MRTGSAISLPPVAVSESLPAGTLTDVSNSFAWDVSARVKAESVLQQMLAGLDAHAIVATTDPIGRITYVNDKFCDISKYSREELIGNDHRIVSSGQHSKTFISGLWTTIRSGQTWKGQLQNRAKDGTSYWLDSTIVPVRDSNGEIITFVAICSDVTEHRVAVLLLERAAAEMEERNRELAAANTKALAATHAKSAFLASMSHEIRTPMNAIIGMTELLNETSLDVQQREYAGRLTRAASSLLELVDDILDISRIEANQVFLEAKAFDLVALVDGVSELLAPRAFAKRLEFVTVVHQDVPTYIQGDPTRVRQVLVNLAGNAIKFTKRGEVVVRVEPVRDHEGRARIQFAVIDTGIGIPADKLSRVFESFTQADTSTTRKYGGTGLGLSISRQLVELMGGQLDVTSAPGCGSTFTFTLDLNTSRPDVVANKDTACGLLGQPVLLVMAHETSRLALAGYLSGAGASVIDCPDWASAAMALDALDRDGRPLSIAVLDHQLPGMTGIEMATAIRSRESCSRVASVLCSSELGQPPADVMERLAIVELLPKPVSRKRLFNAVKRALRDRAPAASASAAERPAAVNATPQIAERATRPEPVRLLVVEDLEENREVVRLYLKNLPYEVDMAANGLLGVNHFKAGQYDLVLMDMQMPLMDGYDATSCIRSWERTHGRTPTPIVALTASAFPEDVERAIAAGCNGHIVKPVRKAVLLETIRAHVRLTGGRAA